MNGTVIFLFNSPTTAFKVKKLLYANGIESWLSKKSLQNGCAYALAVPHRYGDKAQSIFKNHGISFKDGA